MGRRPPVSFYCYAPWACPFQAAQFRPAPEEIPRERGRGLAFILGSSVTTLLAPLPRLALRCCLSPPIRVRNSSPLLRSVLGLSSLTEGTQGQIGQGLAEQHVPWGHPAEFPRTTGPVVLERTLRNTGDGVKTLGSNSSSAVW